MAKMRLNKNLLLKKVDIMHKLRITEVRQFNEIVLKRIVENYGSIKFDDPPSDKITFQECTIPPEHRELFKNLSNHYGINFTQLWAIEIIKIAIASGL